MVWAENCTGRSGAISTSRVPVGTRVRDQDTEEEIGELLAHGQELLVAQGGFHGIGNTRFKSSTNRTPASIYKRYFRASTANSILN